MDKIECRTVIKNLTKEGKTTTEIHKHMKNIYKEYGPSISTVKKWAALFKRGRESLEDDPRCGRSIDVVTPEQIILAEHFIKNDREVTVREIIDKFKISAGSAHRILHDHLGVVKVVTKWVPKLLTIAQKKMRIQFAKKILEICPTANQKELLNQMIICDEIWIHRADAEASYIDEKYTQKLSDNDDGDDDDDDDDEPPPLKKYKTLLPEGKIMATIFWDAKGILLIDYLPNGTNIISNQDIRDQYYGELFKKLTYAINCKRQFNQIQLILHENVSLSMLSQHHKQLAAAQQQQHHQQRQQQQQELFDNCVEIYYPSFSPDLSPSDFYLFANLKNHLRGKKFANDNALKLSVDEHFAEKEQNYFTDGLSELIDRAIQCIEIDGDYVLKN